MNEYTVKLQLLENNIYTRQRNTWEFAKNEKEAYKKVFKKYPECHIISLELLK